MIKPELFTEYVYCRNKLLVLADLNGMEPQKVYTLDERTDINRIGFLNELHLRQGNVMWGCDNE